MMPPTLLRRLFRPINCGSDDSGDDAGKNSSERPWDHELIRNGDEDEIDEHSPGSHEAEKKSENGSALNSLPSKAEGPDCTESNRDEKVARGLERDAFHHFLFRAPCFGGVFVGLP